MTTHRDSSMHICMCQHCSTQTHSSLRVIGRELPSHLSNINSTLKRTFSTPAVLNSTAQKPYSGSQNLPPQDLGMIISSILSLRYDIPLRASCILNPSLNLLIKSSITSSGGPPTPAFHIPQDLTTIFEPLQLEFLQRAGIIEILHQHQQSQTPKGSPKRDLWDELVWRHVTGTRNLPDPPFMSIPGALAFSISVYWFNSHGKSTWLASIGPIMLICLNLLPSERLKL
ncbi:hypothetical protein O181_059424 [Austropuccinia psidii MF-1]|uniref:Uncharacterized protein n=1 Tax=Austropuccinia psidii MF-1 TaxID=1389203 RepID=A0A9Q3EEC4_9BASI|nr:hypothetical protein [Austropuccinia psidii MF-1]